MGHRASQTAVAAQILLQDALDSSETIGRWEYDVPNDRVYADALVALVFNLDPVRAEAGAPLSAFLDGIHPDDRERAARTIAQSAEDGLSCTLEYRVCSADGVTRWILDRGRIAHDRTGRPTRGSGILVDITQTKQDAADICTSPFDPRSSLERAAEHSLAARDAIHELPDSVLHLMSNMLLLEIGRQLSDISDVRRQGGTN
ncbi:PAS domain-containing protein [Methylobacterium sp. J-090]|uniref:PAS domain-containing protein n=1 Tax=Methylobacterium sp. J-090 TaxID=2836666 RepID=UPI001FB9B5E5|nr:PAS domain-containing protein [Methylobacterium sp. J-090]MCJ2080275.1 PAS domain-containing protein [Methylobacterium sp. J-090]